MTTTTTDFQEWLDNLPNEDFDVMRDLNRSINDETNIGNFTCSRKDATLFVKSSDHNVTLMLRNPKSVNAFLKKINSEHGGESGSIEDEDYYDSTMDKDD